jgi:hypothetical protein
MDADWHDEQVSRAAMRDEVARILRAKCSPGVDIDAAHRNDTARLEREGWKATFTACVGPCNQGRKLCPCPEACERMDSEPATSKDMAWVYCCIAVPIVLIAAAAVIGWLV